jgi:hypothetical protein
MTPLRQRLIEDLQLRGFSARTQEACVHAVHQLARHFHKSPDLVTDEDLRQDFLPLTQVRRYARATVTIALCGIKCFVEHTLGETFTTLSLMRPPHERTLAVVLGRYVFRIAITNNRLECFDQGRVTFRFRDRRTGQMTRRTLPAPQFLARFLHHVLPRGFATIRHEGLASPTCRRQLDAARAALLPASPPVASSSPPDDAAPTADTERVVIPDADRCPHCHVGRFHLVATLPRPGQPPCVSRADSGALPTSHARDASVVLCLLTGSRTQHRRFRPRSRFAYRPRVRSIDDSARCHPYPQHDLCRDTLANPGPLAIESPKDDGVVRVTWPPPLESNPTRCRGSARHKVFARWTAPAV